MTGAITLNVPAYTRNCDFCCSGPRRRFARVGMPRWCMTAPIRQRIPLPVGDERGIQLRTGAEQDRDQVTPSVRAWPVELGQAEHSLISGGVLHAYGPPRCRSARRPPGWRTAEPLLAHVIPDLPGKMQRDSRSYQPWRRGGRGEKSPSCANAPTPFDGGFKPCDRIGQVAGGSGDVRPGGNV